MPAERVGLFIAGVQKAATTTLHSHLASHPAIMTGDRKELHFFDNETIDWAAPDYTLLHNRFEGQQSGRVALDSTPIYTFWPPAPARIRAYNPQARLIVLFRDPIARAWSHWRMETGRGTDKISFSEAIRTGRKRLDPAYPLTRVWRIGSYVERGFYARQVRALLDLFPRNQLLLLDSADLTRDPQGTLDRVTQFAGIPALQAVPLRRDYEGAPASEPIAPEDVAFLREIFHEEMLDFAALSGIDISGWPTLNPDAPVT